MWSYSLFKLNLERDDNKQISHPFVDMSILFPTGMPPYVAQQPTV